MSTTTATQTNTLRAGTFTRVMRILYIVSAWLFALCILIQVFLAGMGVFDSATWFSVHVAFAHNFEYIAVLLLILSLLGRFPRAIPLLSLLLIVQFALQYAFVQLSGQLGVLFLAAFHPVNAVVMFWVTQHVARRAMTYIASTKKQA
ncbi:MAG TPA: DUF6220 domain-containing protein [Ktedonobacteraceae bacterium]